MARKQKPPEAPPSKAYLVSFGDTMTTLLAFFIVLCSLAEEQTGANLHSGTGSFIRAVDSFGMPGMFRGESSSNAVPRQETSPLYIAEGPEGEPSEKNPTGPDADDNGLRVIDREAENFQRFLNEMSRLFDVDSPPRTKGQVVFDFFNKLNAQPPYLATGYADLFRQVIPLLGNDQYRVDVIVWSTTPGDSAWSRAAQQASGVRAEIIRAAGLNARQSRRLQATGKPWLYADVKRPELSVVVRKIENAR